MKLLRVASLVICAIVVASFATFAVEQTKSASGHQQAELKGEVAPGSAVSTSSKEGSVHKKLDEAFNELTSPFASIVSGSSSEWAIRGVKLLLALLVYGFGLSYLARVL
ncbi:MAG TPA: hypothetical protein VK252_09160, partial [Solirubrobacteraceae bacterium]|nr:hypothetical protein [Solirubrobacteraceae bacterium]